mmetsp:Transcript_8984/g.16292  ORF Transcript_8984/g.16292 Transcript_8984/m.16292 type:complete len:112 (-) Transcript_8984:711-1046(-)
MNAKLKCKNIFAFSDTGHQMLERSLELKNKAVAKRQSTKLLLDSHMSSLSLWISLFAFVENAGLALDHRWSTLLASSKLPRASCASARLRQAKSLVESSFTAYSASRVAAG